jgi:hypothetical protein
MKDLVEFYHFIRIQKWMQTDLVKKCLEYGAKPLKIVDFGPHIEEMTWLPTFLPWYRRVK